MNDSRYQPARSSRTASDTRSACWPETTSAGPRHRANSARSLPRMIDVWHYTAPIARRYLMLRRTLPIVLAAFVIVPALAQDRFVSPTYQRPGATAQAQPVYFP